MIPRYAQQAVHDALARQAAVALIGPRRVGKTTLARTIADRSGAVYLDLEASTDRAKLADARLFLAEHENRLVVLDEIHRAPGLLPELRGLIDDGRHGRREGRFLMIGSASMALLPQAEESLAGRIAQVGLGPLDVHDVAEASAPTSTLWVRGGFPDSLLAPSDDASVVLRRELIQTCLERDVPKFSGRRIPALTLERLWTMLAHSQGQLLNASKLAGSLAVSSPTVSAYIDLLANLLLVRRLPPLQVDVRKRLVKSPKVYVRDSGIVHALLGIVSHDDLIGHPIAGASWEGFVIENLLVRMPGGIKASFYGTRSGAEMDLVLEFPEGGGTWAIGAKLGLVPKITRGFQSALEDIAPTSAFVVYSGSERYPLAANVEVIGLRELAAMVAGGG